MTEAPQQAPAQATPEATADIQPEAQPQADRTFTQADLKKIAATEKREGKQAAINDLLQKAGAESIDDVLSAYQEYQRLQESQRSEADKAKAEVEKAKAQAKAFQERHETTLREYALRDALRDSGINSERLPLALKVADFSSLELAEDGSVAGVEAAVEAIREASPEWFGTTQTPRVNAPQTSGTGVARPNGLTPEEQHVNWLMQAIGGG